MRILHVTSELPPRGATSVARLIDEQRLNGHVIAVASLQTFATHEAVTQFVARTLGGATALDLIHAHGTAAATVALSLDLPTTNRPPVIVTLHDWVHDEGIRSARPHAAALAAADIVTAPSVKAASLVTVHGVQSQRVRVIPYAVEATPLLTAVEEPLDRELVSWRTRGGDVLCAVSHSGTSAHHEVVLQALSHLSRQESLLCVLAGELDAEACARYAMTLGVEDRVRFYGAHVQARAIAARCDYVTLPAFDERRPFALVEAWCDGVPVIAGRNKRFTGMDGKGNGTIFFDAHSPADLARAIATVRDTTPAARRLLIERARAQYRQHFSPRAVYKAYLTEYDDLRSRASRRTGHRASTASNAV